jgi:hypothetical protein
MKLKKFLYKFLISIFIATLVMAASQLIVGDFKSINFGFKSLLRCGLVEAGGNIQSPFIEGTEKDYWVFRAGNRRSYSFFNHDLIMQKLDLAGKKLKSIQNYLHPENILKGHDPKQKLSKEQLQEVMQAMKGPQDPENIQKDQLQPSEEAISNFDKYLGRCYTEKRGLFDLRNESVIISFGASH